MILHKIVRKLVVAYRKAESKDYGRRVKSIGQGSLIGYPCLLDYADHTTIGKNTEIKSYGRLQTFPHECQDSHITIGDDSFFGFRFSVQATAPIEFGNHDLFGSDISVISHNHGMDLGIDKAYMDQPLISKPIKIGDNVWVGDKSVILPGVTIGNNVIIGAGSIVNKSIPDDSIAVGVPARVIKKYNKDTKEWEKI